MNVAGLMDGPAVYRPEIVRGFLYVPIRACAKGIVTIRAGRLPSGERVGLGFTSSGKLAAVLGSEQSWILVHIQALHQLLAPCGIRMVQVDATALIPPRQRQASIPAG